MALALTNPNDRRRINKITRAHIQTGTPVKILVQEWLAESRQFNEDGSPNKAYLPKKRRSPTFQRDSEGKIAKLRKELGLGPTDKLPKGALKKIFAAKKAQTPAQKAAYARVRRDVARAFAELGGAGYKKGGKYLRVGLDGKLHHHRGQTYAARAVAGKASRYLHADKWSDIEMKLPGKKGTKVTTLGKARIVSKSGAQKWAENRDFRRAEGTWGKVVPWDREDKERPTKSEKVKPGTTEKVKPGTKFSAAYPEEHAAAKSRRGKSRSNPRHYGALALTNPGVIGGTYSVLRDQAVPMSLGVATGAGVHAAAIIFDVPGRLADLPVVGGFLEKPLEMAPATTQGLLVGSVGIAASLLSRGTMVSPYLLGTSVSAIAFGVGLDLFNGLVDRFAGGASDEDLDAGLGEELEGMGALALENGFGALALENGLGALALENTSALGAIGLGDGMAYETAPVSASGVADYSQAALADAFYSGADFSGPEGSALVNGRAAFFRRFGAAPFRAAGRAGRGPSHLAGREGHRWGWLIKTVGWDQAQAICALPPARRVAILKRMREAALATYQQELAADQAASAAAVSPEVPAAGVVPDAPVGATNFLGEPALFAGEAN